VTHNTIVGGSVHMEDWTNGSDHPPEHTSGTVQDNVLAGGMERINVPTLAEDYNLLPSGGEGAHDIHGQPVFVGGASPTSYAGFALAPGSPGKGAASDGTDVGVQP
jgi:hypothetical protein